MANPPDVKQLANLVPLNEVEATARAAMCEHAEVVKLHPGDRADTFNVHSTANTKLNVEFFGTTAHAGGNPWQGRNALHAVELFCHGINLMREQMEPTGRVQYIVENIDQTLGCYHDFSG